MTQQQKRALIVTAAVCTGALFLVLIVAFFHYNALLSRDMVSTPWRTPIEIAGADGQVAVRVYGDDWRVGEPLRLRDLPPHVARAFLAAEDVRFYHHAGVDPIGLLRAAAADVRGHRIAQGGSTITQQFVKGKLFSNARTFRRKIPEMFLAVLLTLRMSKDDVLEGYLNEVYLGQSGGAPVLGLDEAARLYFGKAPGALTVDEAALIAGLVRAPNRTPENHLDQARSRRDDVLAAMRDQKWISDEEYGMAVKRPVKLNPGTLPDTPFGHYLSAMRSELAQAGVRPVAGSRILCELDPSMQQAAENVARRSVADIQRQYPWLRRQRDLQIAILSVDPRSGGVRALVGSRDFRDDSYDRTRRMHRQPGSAIKPFVYAAALASRKFMTTSVLMDEPLTVRLDRRHFWEPQDYDQRYRGAVTLRVALEESLNIPTVRLAQSLGLPDVVKVLQSFGFEEDFKLTPSLPLGVTDVSLRELVSAYSAFPNGGQRIPLHLVTEIRNAKGRTTYRANIKPVTACEPSVAWMVHDLMRGVVLRGTASRLTRDGLDFVAGKTGTTSDYRDAWFVGYSSDLLTGLWIGSDSGTPLRLSAGEVAVPLWSAYSRRVKMSSQPIMPPAGVTFREIDPSNGGIYERRCEGPIRESFLAGTEPTETCTGERIGRRPLLARAEGNPEPSAITDQQSASWSEQSQGEAPDAPEVITRGGAGRVPELTENDDEQDTSDAGPAPQKERKAHHRGHRKGHHRRSRNLPGLLRRIFG